MKEKQKLQEKREYLYDIIDFWLSNEKYEYYISALIDNLDNIFELKEKSLASIVLDKFVNSCKEELKSQKSNVVSKEYYLKVFNKIYNHTNYKHNEEELLNSKYKDLLLFIRDGNYKSERKQNMYSVTDRLYKKEKEIEPLYKVEECALMQQIGYFKEYLRSAINDKSRIDFTNEETIIIGRKEDDLYQYAYSINYARDGSILLRFHVVDMNSLMYSDTPLYHDMKNNNRLNDKLINMASLRTEKSIPTITYQLNINNKGRIYNFKNYKSKIRPKKILDSRLNIKQVTKNADVKQYVRAYKLLDSYYGFEDEITNLKDLDIALVDILNNVVGKYIKNNELVSIYKVQENPNTAEFANQIINLNWFMYRLKDEEFRKVYSIICNANNKKAHYSLKNIGHYGENSNYSLGTTKPFSFIGLKQQQILNDFLGKGLSQEDIEKEHATELLMIANYYNKKFYSITTKEVLQPKKKKKKEKQRVRKVINEKC